MADFNSITSGVRGETKARADRMIGADPTKPVDASGYTPPGAMMNDIKTGMRPISRRQFKAGGKVSGEKATEHAGRKPRASGGNVGISYANRDMKAANEERPGLKHVGGMKRGGKAGGGKTPERRWAHNAPLKPDEMAALHAENAENIKKGYAPYPTVQPNQRPSQAVVSRRASGGRAHKTMGGLALPAWSDAVQRASGGRTHGPDCDCAKCGGGRVGKSAGGVLDGGTRPKGDRIARAKGGRAKKGTTVNVIIAGGAGQKPPMPMPPPGAMPPGPVGLHQGVPPPAAAAPMGPPAGGAPPMPMPRKSGGRTGYPIESGAGGGLGRLEKAKAYG
jgi:hypothetical protein